MSRSLYIFALAGVVSAAAIAGACSASTDETGFGDTGGGGSDTSGDSKSGQTSTGVGGVDFAGANGTGTGASNACAHAASEDGDMDGFTGADGDCNDCDANVNPGAIEVVATEEVDGGIPEPADEDCDGMVDNVAALCDDAIALEDGDPKNAARAIDLCQEAVGKKWGVESAAYVRADGTPASAGLEVGILDGFGPNVSVQLGKRMLGISSGYARTATQPGNCGGISCSVNGAGVAPAGFPQDVPNCVGGTNINDDIGLEVKLKSPTNATGYSFLFRFYSFEYPEWVCTTFNDQFIALVEPQPMGSINGNISFDSMLNPVSVNVAFFDVCDGCPAGTAEMQDTGFNVWDDAGGTSWLKTTAPIKGGDEVTIRFAIWDTGDTAWDSTALIDGFQWIANGGTVGVGTVPDPDPK